MEKKPSNKQHVFIKSLMIVSQMLLTGFLVFWLMEQYKNQEEGLRKEMTFLFAETKNSTLDSLIQIEIINPLLADSSFTVEKTAGNNPFPPKMLSKKIDTIFTIVDLERKIGGQMNVNVVNTEKNNDSILVVKTDNSFSLDSLTRDTVIVDENLNRTIRILLSKSKNEKSSVTLFSNTSSNAKIQTAFQRKLEEKGFDFKLDWIDNDKLPAGFKKSKIHIDSSFPIVGVSIRGYRKYLLWLLLPQFLLVLSLLGLTAFAFYFTYSSLKKQYLLNALRKNFISNITHELKTPVATVKVALEALNQEDLKQHPSMLNDYLGVIGEETNRLDTLISKVMTHARLDNKAIQLDLEKTNLENLVREVIEKMKMQPDMEAMISLNAKDDAYWVYVDRVYIFSVIQNLLDNSLKYAKGECEINISLSEKGNLVFLSVKDNGVGIPETYLPQIFDTFFRVPQGDRHDVKGYGLGLSFAKLVMEEHGGRISARNIHTGGVEFILQFPKA